MKRFSTNCGDWYRGWGLGHTMLGKLYSPDNEGWYEWVGYRQGRHNNKLSKTFKVKFKVNDQNKISDFSPDNKFNSLPEWQDVLTAIEGLKQIIKNHETKIQRSSTKSKKVPFQHPTLF